MAFRNAIVKISQLVADRIVGAFIATSNTAPRTVIQQAGGGYAGLKDVTFESGSSSEVAPAYIGSTFTGPPGGHIIEADFVGAQFTGMDPNARPRIHLEATDEAGLPGVPVPGGILRLIADVVSLDVFGAVWIAGYILHGIEVGNAISDVTDASSRITIPHGLGTVPDFFGVTMRTNQQVRQVSKTFDHVVLEFRLNTGPLTGAGSTVTLDYFAIT